MESELSEYQSTVIHAESKFGDNKPTLGGPGLQPPGGGGTLDGMEARVAKLESAVDYIQRDIGEIKTDIRALRDNARTDFRLLFGAIIAVALGLAGLMAKGFNWL